MLVIPRDLPRVGIQCDGRVRIKCIVGEARPACGIAQRACVIGGSGTEENKVQIGIVTTGGPNRPATELIERQAVPTVSAWLAGTRDAVKPPCFFARLRIQSGDISAAFAPST